MIAFIVSRLLALVRLETAGKILLAPRLAILKAIVTRNPLIKGALRILRITPARFARLVETGKVQQTIQKQLVKYPRRTRKALRIINKMFKQENIKQIVEPTPAKPKKYENKKLRATLKTARRAYLEKDRGEYIVNQGRTTISNGIIRTIFLSTWNFEGIYDMKTKHCRLYHSGRWTQKWYDYPRFPYSWYKRMAEAKSPGGAGAGKVWWLTYGAGKTGYHTSWKRRR